MTYDYLQDSLESFENAAGLTDYRREHYYVGGAKKDAVVYMKRFQDRKPDDFRNDMARYVIEKHTEMSPNKNPDGTNDYNIYGKVFIVAIKVLFCSNRVYRTLAQFSPQALNCLSKICNEFLKARKSGMCLWPDKGEEETEEQLAYRKMREKEKEALKELQKSSAGLIRPIIDVFMIGLYNCSDGWLIRHFADISDLFHGSGESTVITHNDLTLIFHKSDPQCNKLATALLSEILGKRMPVKGDLVICQRQQEFQFCPLSDVNRAWLEWLCKTKKAELDATDALLSTKRGRSFRCANEKSAKKKK